MSDSGDESRTGNVYPLFEPCDVCGDDHCVRLKCLDQRVEDWVAEQLDARDEAEAAAWERAEEAAILALAEERAEDDGAAEPPEEKPRGANRQIKARPGSFDRGDQVELAERLLKVLQGKGPALIRDDSALYRYETADGVWREVTQDAQSCIVQDFAGEPVMAGKTTKDLKIGASDVSGAIKLAGNRAAHPGYFTSEHAPVGVAFANGFVTCDENGLVVKAHDPANRARFGFEFAFERGTRPPMFTKFLDAVFVDDADREQKIAFVQEFGGVALLGLGPRFQKCFVATSTGSTNGQNGKSQLAEVFCGVMPVGAVSCVRPQDLNNEYRRAELAGKLLNCVAEMPEGDILDSTSFKSVVTGDRIDGRYIRQAPFWFFPRAAGYYACNQPPGTSDFSRAFFRRFEFITFNRVFTEGSKDYVQDIGKKIVHAERPRIAAWFLEGALRAMRQGEYTKVPSSALEIEAWRRSVDQVSLFIEDLGERATSPRPKKPDWSPAARTYEGYRAWAEANGHKPLSSNKFAGRMDQAGFGAVHTKDGNFYPVHPKSGLWPTSG